MAERIKRDWEVSGVARVLVVALALILVLSAAAAAEDNVLTEEEQEQGWILLWDGQTLDGWMPNEGWSVEDGTLTPNGKGGGILTTEERYSDFVLILEFKLTEHCNSGVFFRTDIPWDPVNTGIEIQILDSYGREEMTRWDCGAVYECLAPSENACLPAGEWQKLKLTARDNIIEVELNETKIIEMDLNEWTEPHRNPDGTENKFPIAYRDMARDGHIGLQDHGHKLWYRNIKLLPLSHESEDAEG